MNHGRGITPQSWKGVDDFPSWKAIPESKLRVGMTYVLVAYRLRFGVWSGKTFTGLTRGVTLSEEPLRTRGSSGSATPIKAVRKCPKKVYSNSEKLAQFLIRLERDVNFPDVVAKWHQIKPKKLRVAKPNKASTPGPHWRESSR